MVKGHILDIELGYFDQNRTKWLEHHCQKFVLIKGTTVHGFYETMDEAYEIGVKEWGIIPFLVKEVLLKDKVIFMPDRPVIKVMDEDQNELLR